MLGGLYCLECRWVRMRYATVYALPYGRVLARSYIGWGARLQETLDRFEPKGLRRVLLGLFVYISTSSKSIRLVTY